jgi:hypothetical protein
MGYLDLIKKKKDANIEIKTSPRRQALIEQKGKCAKCKKDINPAFSKFITNPETKKIEIICSSCAVSIPKR